MTKNATCPNCSISFSCHVESIKECWCKDYPTLSTLDSDGGCLCPECLSRSVGTKIHQFLLEARPEQAFEIASRYGNTRNAQLIEHIDYIVENGNYVFTRWYHLKRGYCCGNGCRNCPWVAFNTDCNEETEKGGE